MRRYIEKMTGMSRSQVTRLIARYTATGQRPAHRLPAAPFPRSLHAGRHRVAGLGRRGARDLERPGDAAHSGTRASALRQAGVCAAGGDLGSSSVQPAQEPALPRAAFELHQDAAHGGVDRGAAQAAILRASPAICAWIRCIRATSRRPRASITSTPSMRSCSGRWWARHRASSEAYLKPVLEAMMRQFPFRIRGLPHRQRQRVHQPHRRRTAQQAADRADQEPSPAERRQRPGRDQERRGDPQTHRLRLHRCGPCRRHQRLLSGVSESVSELPSPLRPGRCPDR